MERVATQDDLIPLDTPLRKPDGGLVTHLPIKAGQVITSFSKITFPPAQNRLR